MIPSNDDAIRAIKLLVSKIADAVIEGKSLSKDDEINDETLAADSAASRKEAARPRMDEESNLEDKDLLGDSTLAKMTPKSADDVVEETEETK